MKSIITLSFILFLGSNVFSSSIDSISVNVIGDTIYFNNIGINSHCFANFSIRKLFNPWSDTLCLVEMDMAEGLADCNCYFDISAKFVFPLLNQHYILKVFRYVPFFDIERANLIGVVEFDYTGGEEVGYFSTITQSECYDLNDVKEIQEIPSQLNLSQNYPNPFNPSTSIQYAIGSRQFVQLKVYDVLGNEIATLVNEEKPAGFYNVEFRIKNVELSSGIYFYQLKAGDYIQTKKMILLK